MWVRTTRKMAYFPWSLFLKKFFIRRLYSGEEINSLTFWAKTERFKIWTYWGTSKDDKFQKLLGRPRTSTSCGGLLQIATWPDSLLVILLKNDDDELEDIFLGVRGIREQTPLREYPERPELNRGLSGIDFDEQESEQKSPQRRPFKSKYSILSKNV